MRRFQKVPWTERGRAEERKEERGVSKLADMKTRKTYGVPRTKLRGGSGE